MKINIIFLFLFIPVIIWGQNSHVINMEITDTVIVKRDYPYATKINIEITIPDFQDTILLYYFNQNVGSMDVYKRSDETMALLMDLGIFKSQSINFPGLTYIVEDKNHQPIDINNAFFSLLYKYPVEDARNDRTVTFINSRQKIIRKKLNWKKRIEYELARHEINTQKQIISLYMMLSVYHKDLPQGEYYLYLGYSFNPSPQYILKDIVNDSRTFKGTIISNKVKLIVE